MRLKTVTRISFFVGLLTSSALNPDPALAQPTQAAARQSPPQRIHPQPNLTHAGVQYKPAFAEDVASVVRCLEGPIPKRVVELGEETTLRDLHYALAESLPIQVMIDTRAIDERGLDSGQTLKFEQPRDQMTVAAYLDRVLNPHDLIAIAIDGTLSITSEEESYNKQVVAHYPFPTTIADGPDMVRLVDTIQSVVDSSNWDVVGGPNSIRVSPEANELVIATDLRSHRLIGNLIRSGFDSDLEPVVGVTTEEPGFVPVRSYNIRPNEDLNAIAQWVCDTVNAALGPQADPDAQVSVFANRLVIQSRSRPFHIFAAEVVRAINGCSPPFE